MWAVAGTVFGHHTTCHSACHTGWKNALVLLSGRQSGAASFAMVQAVIGIAAYSYTAEWCLEQVYVSYIWAILSEAKGSVRLVRCTLLEAAAVYCVATAQVVVWTQRAGHVVALCLHEPPEPRRALFSLPKGAATRLGVELRGCQLQGELCPVRVFVDSIAHYGLPAYWASWFVCCAQCLQVV